MYTHVYCTGIADHEKHWWRRKKNKIVTHPIHEKGNRYPETVSISIYKSPSRFETILLCSFIVHDHGDGIMMMMMVTIDNIYHSNSNSNSNNIVLQSWIYANAFVQRKRCSKNIFFSTNQWIANRTGKMISKVYAHIIDRHANNNRKLIH